MSSKPNSLFLPVTLDDAKRRGWEELDVVLLSGDAYVDHPSFGTAVIGRVLEARGYRVGVIPQPDWTRLDDFKKLGKPRLFFAISAGNLDSMLSNYTANKRRRREDAYSPGGKTGKRPDRATIVYTNRLREAFPGVPIIIGGIEASLRRFAHYDYWDNKIRRSILLDSRADLLIYGMGENQILAIAQGLQGGTRIEELNDIRGTVYWGKSFGEIKNYLELPSFEEVNEDKRKYAESFKLQYLEQDPVKGKTLIQKHGDQYVIQNPPAKLLNTEQMDFVYNLPYIRDYHPMYEEAGGVPAIREVKFSITSHRGCFGGCSFCSITHHQGKIIQSRSQESILKEVRLLTQMPDFKGIIHDVGGPTANFRITACKKQVDKGACPGKDCLYPQPCKALEVDHSQYFNLLRAIRSVPKVKRVFIRSGVRYDYLLLDKSSDKFLEELCEYHVSGQLKVAPEHISKKVTDLMRKPGKKIYEEFKARYNKTNQKLGKRQYLVPYFIASHPGATLKEAVELAEYIRDMGYHPEQVQDFTPTPGSLATCMYYTELDPFTGQRVYVAKTQEERQMQRALMQFRDPKNHPLVYKALQRAGRLDLVGYGPKALIPPPNKSKKQVGQRTQLRKAKVRK